MATDTEVPRSANLQAPQSETAANPASQPTRPEGVAETDSANTAQVGESDADAKPDADAKTSATGAQQTSTRTAERTRRATGTKAAKSPRRAKRTKATAKSTSRATSTKSAAKSTSRAKSTKTAAKSTSRAKSTKAAAKRTPRAASTSGAATRAATATKPAGESFDVEGALSQWTETARKATASTLDFYVKAVEHLADAEVKAAHATNLPIVATIAETNAAFSREIAGAYAAAARDLINA